MNRNVRTVLVYMTVGFLVLMAVNFFLDGATEPTELTLNEFIAQVEAGNIEEVSLREKSEQLEGQLVDGSMLAEGTNDFIVGYPNEYEGTLTQLLLDNDVTVKPDPENPSLFQWFLGTIFPYLLIFGVFIFILMQMQGGGNRVMQFG